MRASASLGPVPGEREEHPGRFLGGLGGCQLGHLKLTITKPTAHDLTGKPNGNLKLSSAVRTYYVHCMGLWKSRILLQRLF